MPAVVERKKITWGRHLIRKLRGKRTQAAFGELLGVPKNTVWRWEAGRASPHAAHAERLSKLAEREQFLADWNLVGSMTLLGDLEEGSRLIARELQKSLARGLREL